MPVLGFAHVTSRVESVPLTGQIQLFVRDPAGNGVELTFVSSDA